MSYNPPVEKYTLEFLCKARENLRIALGKQWAAHVEREMSYRYQLINEEIARRAAVHGGVYTW